MLQASGMVVHLSPGHTRGTLVNALLGHCGLPAMSVASGSARAGGGGLLDGGAGDDSDGDGARPGAPQHPHRLHPLLEFAAGASITARLALPNDAI